MPTSPLDRHRTSLEYCTYCPKLCRHVCPVSNAEPREAIIPQQKMQTANFLRKGQLDWNAENTEVLYACTGCRACTEVCAHQIEPGRVLMEARAEASRQAANNPRLSAHLPKRFATRAAKLSRKLASLVSPTDHDPSAKRAFHPACTQLEAYPDDFIATWKLIKRRSADVQLVGRNAICGGYALFAAGLLEPWLAAARTFSHAISGHEEVFSGCSACVYLIQQVYPQYGVSVRPKVCHVTEPLEQTAALDRAPQARKQVLFHDACHLGRGLGRYEGPRALLRASAEVEEFPRNRQHAECSGGGGLVPLTMPDAAQKMAERRLSAVQEGDPRPIVTTCATCKRQFEKARPDLSIVDLVAWLEAEERKSP